MLRKKLTAALLVSASLCATGIASAAVPGFYAGVQAGWSNIDYNRSDYGYDHGSVKDSGLGARPFAGFQFDQFFGVETGYTWYANNKLKNASNNLLPGVVTHGDIDQTAWDVLAVGTLPLEQGFSLYAKGGAAYVDAKHRTTTTTSVGQQVVVTKESASTHKWRPVAGVGVNYDFNEMVSGDISWTRIFSGSSISNSDLAAVGVTYHFG